MSSRRHLVKMKEDLLGENCLGILGFVCACHVENDAFLEMCTDISITCSHQRHKMSGKPIIGS